MQRLVHLDRLALAGAALPGHDRAGFAMDLEVDLLTEDWNSLRSLNPDADLLAHDRQHRHLDLIPDHDALVGLAGQNQHLRCTFLFADGRAGAIPRTPV